MKTKSMLTVILAAAVASSSAFADETPAPFAWEEILTGGTFSLNLRLRYEYADQDGLDASHAFTARTRLGYATNPAFPVGAFLELEDIRALDSDAYNQAGTNNRPDKTVIADVETTDLNQAFLSLDHWDATARLGRQRITLDDHRFIGNVGWRQNEQTFDAALLAYKPAPYTALTLGYIDRVNRVFGREHPQGRWDSESYIANFRHPLPGGGVGAVYAYLLRLDDAPALSGDTFGIYLRPIVDIRDQPFRFHFEFARQVDNRANPAGADFALTYFRSEAQTDFDRFTFAAGYELLGSDGDFAVQTPLATLHAFNGWADQFLTTPANGLRDIYGHVTARLPHAFTTRAGYHSFTSHRESITYGHEWNAQVTRPLGKNTTALAKAALFDGKEGRPDVTKFWLQTEIAF
jgi:hypothetical protein